MTKRPRSVGEMMDELERRRTEPVKRPPPPWEQAPKGRREQVSAAQLRPDDWLVTSLGPLRVLDVEHSATGVRLLSNGRWWEVRPSTRFVRIRQERRIDMRPDLKRGGR